MTPTNTINGRNSRRNFAKCEIFNFHVAKSRSSKCINQNGRRIVGNRGVINRNEATFDDDEVVFHRADNRALIGPGSGFRQEFGASEISENLWRRAPTNFESKSRNVLTRVGGRGLSDARSILPAGMGRGNSPSRNCERPSSFVRGPNFIHRGAITMPFPSVIAGNSLARVYAFFDNWALA